ncbi:MAG: alpha-ketoglutarate-dependent dioxygenase AlkB [Verrucomicrobiae bacterium]|nr:alpha-ketoglutarate-dependent dioxygenase AlkB [Verrucomicrobiae bacterium]
MDLIPPDSSANLLPCDGIVNYHGPILSAEEADHYFARLRETIAWRHDEVTLFGRHIVTAREVAWYGDRDFAYTYSGTTRTALPWTEELAELKTTIETLLDSPFNSCLINLYHSGSEGMGWHSDDETTLVENATIASLSLGAERKFSLRHKRVREKKVSVILEPGSLLAMRGETQQHWSHALPKSKRVTDERINLTFRLMKWGKEGRQSCRPA